MPSSRDRVLAERGVLAGKAVSSAAEVREELRRVGYVK
jgi:hypothetical protein